MMSIDVTAIATGTGSAPSSAPSSAPGSPKSRVKFLCSHGGKILPRPADGHLKYVGGETRVISVHRDIHFQELMKKLTYMIDGETILKYQVVSEDLDALVSVKSDEDLRHMCDEIERYEIAGAPRLRAFLFPANPIVMEHQNMSVDHYALEQRYIDAINGIIRLNSVKQHPNINAVQNGSLVSSGCSSPRSPDSCTTEAMMNNEATTVYYNSRLNMHKVQSSPNICSLNNNNYVPQQNGGSSQYIQQHHQVSAPHYVHHYNMGYQLPNKPPIDQRSGVVGPDRLISVRSVGRADGVRYQMDLPPQQQCYYNSSRQQNRGSGCCNKCIHYEDLGHFPERRMNGRLSPASSSPRFSYGGVKPWDSTIVGDI